MYYSKDEKQKKLISYYLDCLEDSFKDNNEYEFKNIIKKIKSLIVYDMCRNKLEENKFNNRYKIYLKRMINSFENHNQFGFYSEIGSLNSYLENIQI